MSAPVEFELNIKGTVEDEKIKTLDSKTFTINGVNKSSELGLDNGALTLVDNNAQQSSSAQPSATAPATAPVPQRQKSVLSRLFGTTKQLSDTDKKRVSLSNLTKQLTVTKNYSKISEEDKEKIDNIITDISKITDQSDETIFNTEYENFKTTNSAKINDIFKNNYKYSAYQLKLVGGKRQTNKQRKSHKYLYRVRVNSRSKKNRRNNKK